MSNLTKHPQSTLRLWLRFGRLLALTGVISLLAVLSLASLGACAATPQPPVEVSLPDTPSPTSTSPPSTPPPASTSSPLITPTPVISFNMNDLTGGPTFREVKNLTAIFDLYVTNRGSITAPETFMYVYDGDPQAGGKLIAQETFPYVPPAGDYHSIISKEAVWDVQGKAGEHEIFSYLCLAGVKPSSTTCHTWTQNESIPRFMWDIEIANSQEGLEFGRVQVDNRFERGDKVLIRRYAINLTADETFAFTMTSTIYKGVELLERVLTEDSLTLAPGQVFEQVYEYDTSLLTAWGAGIYLDIDGLQSQFPMFTDRGAWEKSTGFTFPLDAYFTATPLTGRVPLTVTFINGSVGTDAGYPIENWLWSFGDSLTSTERFPTHVYTSPGRYSVALTATTIGNNLWAVRELSSMGAITDPTIFTRTFWYTYTRPNYINVLPPDID